MSEEQHALAKRREYVFQQYYCIEPNATRIDAHYQHVHSDDPYLIDEERERMHRLFQSILGNEKALQKVMVYQVLSKHGVEYGDASEEFIKGVFGRDIDFLDVLRLIEVCFTSEDRDWLAQFDQSADEQTRYLTLEGLEDAFEVKVSGWDIGRVNRHREELHHTT